MRRIATIGAPLMVAQGGMVTMGLVDTFFVGRVSPLQVAAVGLGSNMANLVMAAAIGTAMGIEPLVSQALGRGDATRGLHWLRQGLWLALLLGIPLALASLLLPSSFSLFGVEPELARSAGTYVLARAPGHLACFMFSVYRSYLSAVGDTAPLVRAVVIANVWNAVLDAALVWGCGWGAGGVGVATTLCWMVLLVQVARAVRAEHGVAFRWADIRTGNNTPSPTDLRLLFAVGAPIGMQFVLEVGIFGLISLWVASFGTTMMAGHQIALTMAALVFMAVTGFAIAATSRVGHFVGKGQVRAARSTGLLAITMGAAVMSLGAVAFITLRFPIAAAFAPGAPEVVQAGAALLVLAAWFAVSDGVQAVAAGALRGVGDTAFIFYANVVGHWLVGVPVAYTLGFTRGLGAVGLWWGLVVGLSATAVILLARFLYVTARPVRAIEGDGSATS